jgi:hypothetical protein
LCRYGLVSFEIITTGSITQDTAFPARGALWAKKCERYASIVWGGGATLALILVARKRMELSRSGISSSAASPTQRKPTMDNAPEPSNAEQSAWPDATCEYVASLHIRIEQLIELALQYRNDLKFGLDGDSKIRRIEAIEKALQP